MLASLCRLNKSPPKNPNKKTAFLFSKLDKTITFIWMGTEYYLKFILKVKEFQRMKVLVLNYYLQRKLNPDTQK